MIPLRKNATYFSLELLLITYVLSLKSTYIFNTNHDSFSSDFDLRYHSWKLILNMKPSADKSLLVFTP